MANEREVAHQTQEKFEFYLLGLVFTLLGLSIQTAHLGQSIVADSCELLGWLSLFVSGLVGLWRLEYVPVWRLKFAQKEEFERKIDELRELQHTKGVKEAFVLETQTSQPIAERIGHYQEGISALNPILIELEQQNRWKYQVHRYGFAIGLSMLLVSRSYHHVMVLISNVMAYFNVT